MSDEVSYGELSHSSRIAQLGVSASDLHGTLTGFLCAGGSTTPQNWVRDLELDADRIGSEADVFEQLHADVSIALDDSGLGFEPLLPPDTAPLAERAVALVEWCRGLLGGIGLANAAKRVAALDDDGREILRDIGEIAATRFDFSDSEEDEQSLAELIEYVRIGVLTLHAEFHRPSDAGNQTVH